MDWYWDIRNSFGVSINDNTVTANNSGYYPSNGITNYCFVTGSKNLNDGLIHHFNIQINKLPKSPHGFMGINLGRFNEYNRFIPLLTLLFQYKSPPNVPLHNSSYSLYNIGISLHPDEISINTEYKKFQTLSLSPTVNYNIVVIYNSKNQKVTFLLNGNIIASIVITSLLTGIHTPIYPSVYTPDDSMDITLSSSIAINP